MGIIDKNGEPKVVYHTTSDRRKGEKMSTGEFRSFAIEVLTGLYRSEGLKITNINMDDDYPRFVMESQNGKIYYVVIDATIFPNRPNSGFIKNNHSYFLELARRHNAIPVYASIAFVNATRKDRSEMICGDGYFVVFKGLSSLL